MEWPDTLLYIVGTEYITQRLHSSQSWDIRFIVSCPGTQMERVDENISYWSVIVSKCIV